MAHTSRVVQEATVIGRDSIRGRCSCGWYGTPFLPAEYREAWYEARDHAREARAWAAMENVPCAHAIPGTCDYC